MLLRGQLAQVSEILQTFRRPGQEKPFIFVQTLKSGGHRGSQRLRQECVNQYISVQVGCSAISYMTARSSLISCYLTRQMLGVVFSLDQEKST